MDINFYGFFIALGILIGTLVVNKVNSQFSILNSQFSIYDLLPWVVTPGIIGARLYHILDLWSYYSKNLLEILYIWNGGLGIFGAIIGGCLGLFAFLLIKSKHQLQQSFSKYPNILISQYLSLLDLAAIGLPIGQAIGRFGNFFNQELYGLPTKLPWGIFINLENRLPGYENFTHFHPLFFYESLGCLIIFFILLYFIIHYSLFIIHKNRGFIFFLYLFCYSLLRFWLEFLRIESWQVQLPFTVNLIRVNQLVSLGLMLISIWFIVIKGKFRVFHNSIL